MFLNVIFNFYWVDFFAFSRLKKKQNQLIQHALLRQKEQKSENHKKSTSQNFMTTTLRYFKDQGMHIMFYEENFIFHLHLYIKAAVKVC